MAFKIIPCYKMKSKTWLKIKSLNSKTKNIHQEDIHKKYISKVNGFLRKVLLCLWVETSHQSDKRTLWMEEHKSIPQNKRSNQGTLKTQMSLSIKWMQIAWGMRKNEYICLTLLRACGVIYCGNQKTNVKWISHFGLRRVINTFDNLVALPYGTIINDMFWILHS